MTKILKSKKNSESNEYPVFCMDITIGLAKDYVAPEPMEQSKSPLKDLLAAFEGLASQFAMQFEEGEENKFKHFQIRIKLRKRRRTKQFACILRNALKNTDCFGQIHVSPTSIDALKDSIYNSYVTKKDTRIAGPWFDDTYTTEIASAKPTQSKCIRDSPHPWQQTILDSLTQDASIRDICVLVDYRGGIGKSAFLAHTVAIRLGVIIPIKADISAILQYVCQMPASKLYILDIPRQFYEASSKKELAQLFSAIESLKNGIIFDTRYKGVQRVINSPHVWIFTNIMISPEAFSKDRWKLYNIDESTKALNRITLREAITAEIQHQQRRKAANIVIERRRNDKRKIDELVMEYEENGIPEEYLNL